VPTRPRGSGSCSKSGRPALAATSQRTARRARIRSSQWAVCSQTKKTSGCRVLCYRIASNTAHLQPWRHAYALRRLNWRAFLGAIAQAQRQAVQQDSPRVCPNAAPGDIGPPRDHRFTRCCKPRIAKQADGVAISPLISKVSTPQSRCFRAARSRGSTVRNQVDKAAPLKRKI
jgi:hypothetical protein